jgi:hypothetical protein
MMEMDSNGDFLPAEWRVRRGLRLRTVLDVERGRGLRPRRVVGRHREVRRCYIVHRHGDGEYVCRNLAYARHVAKCLNAGKKVRSEVKWVVDNGFRLTRMYDESQGKPHRFYYRDMVIRAFEYDIEAESFQAWYEARRTALMERSPRKEFQASEYLSFREREELDKPLSERVYELLSVLTGTEEGVEE